MAIIFFGIGDSCFTGRFPSVFKYLTLGFSKLTRPLFLLPSGHWLLIDNANLCSPSVMDRLNPLMEHGGNLIISERGVLDGDVQVWLGCDAQTLHLHTLFADKEADLYCTCVGQLLAMCTVREGVKTSLFPSFFPLRS